MMNYIRLKIHTLKSNKFFKFLLIGGFCALQNTIWLYILTTLLGLHYIVSTIILMITVNTLGFYLNRRFTFNQQDDNFWQELVKYHTVMLSSCITVLILMYVLVDIIKIWYLFAHIIITIGMTLVNYFMHQKWTFKSDRSPMKVAKKVALIALLWVIVINRGPVSGDTLSRLDMAHAWWTGTAEISLAPGYKPKSRLEPIGVLGVGGKRYITYDVGQSLLMLPGDWLGTQVHKVVPKIEASFLRRMVVSFLIFTPLNVAVVVACFWLLRLFEFEERTAGLASITWLISTTVFHYAQAFQQNHQVLLFATIGYAAALACVRQNQPRFALLCGLALSAATLIRMTSVIHVLTGFLFLVGCAIYCRCDRHKIFQIIGMWIIGFMPLTLLGKIFDYLRYGSFWTTGQSLVVKQLNTDPIYAGLPELPANFPMTNPPLVGIWGVLFSPAKSIFIYDPLLIPCLVLGFVLWKQLSPYIKLYAIAAIFNLGLYIVSTSQLDFWHGDAAWGARYQVTSVHLLLIPLIGLFIQRLLSVKRWTQWLMQGLLVLAIMAQIASVILRSSAEVGNIYFEKPETFQQFRLAERVTNVGCLINSSFATDCQSRLYYHVNGPLIEKVELLPLKFTQGRNLVFMVWSFVLIMAIFMTVRFCFVG